MKLGFIGSSYSLTTNQRYRLRRYLEENKVLALHHTDHIGSAEQVHDIATSLGIDTHVHPSTSNKYRAGKSGTFNYSPARDNKQRVIKAIDKLLITGGVSSTTIKFAESLHIPVRVLKS